MKKWLAALVVSLLIFTTPLKAEEQPELLKLQAWSAILIDAKTGAVLYEKDSHAKMQPASLTKIMTNYLALKNGKLEDMLTVSETAVDSIDRTSSHIALTYDEEITLKDAVHASLMASANDASNVIAEYLGGSLEHFAELMNEEAKRLGMNDTHFVNAHGLPDENHLTTAYDLALLTREAIQNPEFAAVFKEVSYKMALSNKSKEERIVATGNEMLKKGKLHYEYATGGKIGWTSDAGYTMVTTAEKDGISLIAVVLKCPASADRYSDTLQLFEYGFSQYKSLQIASDQVENNPYETKLNKKDSIRADALVPEAVSFLIPAETDESALKVMVEWNDDNKEELKAYAVLKKDGTELSRQNIAVKQEVIKKETGIGDYAMMAVNIVSVAVFFLFMIAAAMLIVRRKK